MSNIYKAPEDWGDVTVTDEENQELCCLMEEELHKLGYSDLSVRPWNAAAVDQWRYGGDELEDDAVHEAWAAALRRFCGHEETNQ